MRDKVKIFTKVGSDLGLPGHKGLSKAWIQQAVDDSLRRLNTDYIDLYFSHWPDPQTPVAETLEAFHSLQQAGKIRAMGASNLDAMQLAGALEVARKGGLPAWQVLQPEYNLYHRSAFEGALCDLCVSRDIGVVTYYSLASGFLTGKYRQPSDLTQSQRGSGIGKYLNPRGMRIIDTLAAVADEQGAKPAEVALAWLIGREGVTAPIATSVAYGSICRAAALSLSAEQVARWTGRQRLSHALSRPGADRRPKAPAAKMKCPVRAARRATAMLHGPIALPVNCLRGQGAGRTGVKPAIKRAPASNPSSRRPGRGSGLNIRRDGDRRPGEAPHRHLVNKIQVARIPQPEMSLPALRLAGLQLLCYFRADCAPVNRAVCVMAGHGAGSAQGRPVAAAPVPPGSGQQHRRCAVPSTYPCRLRVGPRQRPCKTRPLSPHPCGLPRPSGNVSAMLRPQHRQFQSH